jgi:acyl carrier protein
VKELCAFVARTLKIDAARINEESGPLTLPEWDSFQHVHLMSSVETAYKVEIPLEEVVSILSVRDLAELLTAKGVRVE